MATMAPTSAPARDLYRWRDPYEAGKRYVLGANGDLTVVDSTSSIDIFKSDGSGEGWKYFVKHVVGLVPEKDPVEQLSLIFGSKAEYIPDNPIDRPRARVTTYVSKDRGTPAATPEQLEEIRAETLTDEPDRTTELRTFKCKVCKRTRLTARASSYDKNLCEYCNTAMRNRGIKTPEVKELERQLRAKQLEARRVGALAERIARKRPGAMLAENGYPLCLCGCGEPVTDIDNLWRHGHAKHGLKLVDRYERREIVWDELPREIQKFIQTNAGRRQRSA